jgi:formylglycine-generating enzyme required for sulfatase activity/uncharacterized caspase-like protein
MSENWAISIGINTYDNITALSYARQDAEALARFFIEGARFKQVYLMAEEAQPIEGDAGPPFQSRPTFTNLMRFLRARFEQPFLKSSDNLWFFFAGHGRRDRDKDYLLPLDADPGNVAMTAIEVRYVVEQLKKSGAGNVVMLLDACRNIGARDGSAVGLERQNGTVTISSCSVAEFSFEIDDLRHGAFTYALLEGLRLQGEKNCATVERLDAYLQTRVPELCRLHGKPQQTPSTLAEPLAKRHFILLPAIARIEDLLPLKHQALQAETRGEPALAEQLWWRVNAVDPTDAEMQEAIRRLARLPGPPDPVPPDPTPPDPNPPVIPRRALIYAGGVGAGGLLIGGLSYLFPPFGPFKRKMQSRQIRVVQLDGTGQILAEQASRTIDVFEQTIDPRVSIEFSVIPGNRFYMGSPDDEYMRRDNEARNWMTVSDFAISRTVITQQQWRAIVQLNHQAEASTLRLNPSAFTGDDRPVETINWLDASRFCRRLAEVTGHPYRLPTEAEWEYACRAGTETPFHFGPTLSPAVANYCGTGGAVCGQSFNQNVWSTTYGGIIYEDGAYDEGPTGSFAGMTKPVRSYPENAFGLFEMHGNVWEHCLDNWSQQSDDLPRNGKPLETGDPGRHPLRGGSWSHNPAICRSAYREAIEEGNRGWQGRIGFRVACSL